MGRVSAFPLNARVTVHGHGGWPDGTTGTIVPFPEFVREMSSEPPGSPDDFLIDGLVRRNKTPNGVIYSQFVDFDESVDDGSGDGPYRSSEILVHYLRAQY